MNIENKIIYKAKSQGINLIKFVDISHLSHEQSRGFPFAIIVGAILTPEFVKAVTEQPDFVQQIIKNDKKSDDEFHQKEKLTDRLADEIENEIISNGYDAFSQSENNIIKLGLFNEKEHSSPLPHKTIARLAGFGWIGKNNLIVSRKYGSAISMCTILTNAPLNTEYNSPKPQHCGTCQICKNDCPTQAINGNHWDIHLTREALIDADKCISCLRCLAICPWTQHYMRNEFAKQTVMPN